MQKLRKALVVSVGAITILSMSMFMVPVQVGAAAQAGDLIKMAGLSSVYYLGSDNKRYVFPNESTYFSWYSDFSKVVTISQSELESYPLGKNVTVRPGTKLVKITTNPSVYAVTPGGVLLKVPSEAVASTLWGTSWAKRVIDISDAFFTNYTIGSGEVSANAYPAGSLIKYASGADVYYIGSDGKAQKITSEAAFLANGFKWGDIVTAPTLITLPAAGADIAAAVSTINDTSSGAGGTVYTGGSGLTVSLSGDTPASRNLPSYSTLVPFVTVNLTASNDGAITVDQLVFSRMGTGATTDFDGGYLYSGNTILSTKRSVNSSDNTITFNALNLGISAGATKSVTLRMNAKTSGTVSGNHYFGLASASAVATLGSATVSGSFPVAGNLMSYSTVRAGTVTVTGSLSDTSYKIGETQRVLSEFTLADDSYEDVSISRIRLKQYGDASDSAIANLSLDLDGTIVKSGVAMSGKYVDFVLDTPFKIKKSETITATVRGDIISDIGKYVTLYLKDATDLEALGTAYGDFYGVTLSNGLTYTAAADILVKGSEINVSTDGPAATDYKDNTTNVVLANVKLSSANQDVLFDTLEFNMVNNSTVGAYNMLNIELVDSANNASYSIADLTASSTSAKALDFENVYLKKGVQYNFQLRGDIQDNTPAGATFYVTLDTSTGQTAHFQDTDQTLVVDGDYSSSGFTGKTMTVAAPSIVFSTVTTNDSTVTQSAAGALLFKGKVTANNVDNLTVSRVNFTAAVGQPTGQNISKDLQRVYLYKVNADGSETKLADENSLDAVSVGFSGFTLAIPKGLSNGVYVTLRGDVKSTPTATTTKFRFNQTSSNYTVKDSDNTAVSSFSLDTAYGGIITASTYGTYSLDFDTTEAGINQNFNALAGRVVKIGRIKATAAKEAAVINDLVIKNTGTAIGNTAATVYLYKDSGMTQLIGSADFAGSTGASYALLQGINYTIPTTGITYLYAGVLVKPIDYSLSPSADATGVAETTIDLEIPIDSTNYITKVTGASTGQTEAYNFASAASTNSSVTAKVLGAVMSGITSDFANGLLANGTARDLFSFKVTAPASSNVDYDGQPLGINLKTVVFSFATSSGVNAGTFLIQRVGGTNGELSAKNSTGGVITSIASTLTVDFKATYASGTQSDLIVRPGETATYVLRGTIAGVDTSDSLQVTLENVDTSDTYAHHTASVAGTQGDDITAVYPFISGITAVRAGSLTN